MTAPTSTPTAPTTPVPARSAQLVVALACCVVAALAVTALAVGVVGGALAWLGSGGPATDRAMATLLVAIGLLFLAPPAVLMWVALVRLVTAPPRGAALMVGSLRAVAGFVLTVALPVLSFGGSGPVIGAVLGVALAFLGVAQLLAAVTRGS